MSVRKRSWKVQFTGDWSETAPPEPDRDWEAWKDTWEARPPGFFPPDFEEDLEPIDVALSAVQTALDRYAEASTTSIDKNSLKRAAALTTRHARVQVLGWSLGPARHDVLLDAFNRYPHPESTACRWLIPALRNYIRTPREDPSELQCEWEYETERVVRLTLHPHSARLGGCPLQQLALDYEAAPYTGPSSRDALDTWRIRAHLSKLVKKETFHEGILETRPLELSVTRLNQLARYVSKAIAESAFLRSEVSRIFEHFRQFLITFAEDGGQPGDARARYRDALKLLHDATACRIARPYALRLEPYHVEEYERLLVQVQHIQRTARRDTEQVRRLQELGWSEQPPGFPYPHLSTPREVAVALLCIREGLGDRNIQRVTKAIAAVREETDLLSETEPRKSRKKRGRPKKR